MAMEHVRIDYDAEKGQTTLKGTSGDPWVDLGVLIQGLALNMAANVDKRKLHPDHLASYVKQEIDKIRDTKKGYKVQDHNKKSPILLLK